MNTNYKLEILSNFDELSRRATEVISSEIDSSLQKKVRSQIALSGGSTPAKTYSLLGEVNIDWSRVDIFLGDERWVDQNNDQSNAFMLRKTLLAGRFGSIAKFYPVPTTDLPTSKDSANSFSNLLMDLCTGNPPSFDLMVLGLGDDGHTASLFPESKACNEDSLWVTIGEGKGLERITLTAPVLSASRKVIFLISGENKQIALKRLLNPEESPERTPAKLVKPQSEVLILADEVACKRL